MEVFPNLNDSTIAYTYHESLLQILYSLRNTPKTRQTEGNRAEEMAEMLDTQLWGRGMAGLRRLQEPPALPAAP